MKKATIFFLSLTIIITKLYAQTLNHSDYLDIGNVRAFINADGLLFLDTSNRQQANYEVPKGSGKHTIYASTFWMTANSQRNGFPHFSVGYEHDGFLDYIKTGPVDIINQQADTSIQFQRLWEVDKTAIDDHIQNWNTGNYVIPSSILEWPGNGNANTAKNLAPYEDLDNDSIYEPQNGEYPLIKGDQAIFLMANNFNPRIDKSYLIEIRRDSNGIPLGYDTIAPTSTYGSTQLEMHLLLYAYQNQSTDIKNTVFVNVKLFNRSNSNEGNLHDFKFSVFSDFDIGTHYDDYIGTDTIRNMVYAYNADNFDDTSFTNGYGTNLPAQAVMFLDQNIFSSMMYSRSRAWQEFPFHINNCQRNRWRNNRNLYYGGDGFPQIGIVHNPCIDTSRLSRFMFPGDPTLIDDSLQWTEINACPVYDSSYSNPPGDKRMIGTPDLPTTFNHGTSIEFNYAYVFAQDSTGNVASVAQLQTTVDSVQRFFDRNRFVGLQKLTDIDTEVEIYPNPADQKITLKIKDKNFRITIYDFRGILYKNYSNRRTIDVSDYANGIYFIEIRTPEHTKVGKLVIAR